VFPVRYEHRPRTKNKVILVTDHRRLLDCEVLRASHCPNNRSTDAEGIARRHTSRNLFSRNILYLSLLLISLATE
jgi:hypothetical protein